MWKRVAAGWACSALVVCPVSAQPARAEAPAAAASAAGPATNAMERAQRQAANPMRVILEASRSRRRVAPEAAEAADSGAARRPGARASAPATGGATREDEVVAPRAALLPAAPALASPAVPDSGITTQITLSAGLLPTPAAAVGAAPIEATSSVAPIKALAAAAETARLLEPAASQLTELRLVEMVEPIVPPRVLQELGRQVEIVADLALRADGTVAAVVFVPPVPRQLLRATQAALEQWRYEPLGAPRMHRVQVVFNPGL